MRRRIRSILSFPLPLVYTLEAVLVGLFWLQALRFLIGSLYARIASASLFPALNPNLIDRSLPGLVEPATVNNELSLLVYILILPLLTLVAGRFRWLFILAVAVTAVGRYLMVSDEGITSTAAAAITLGGGLLYIALLIRHRARIFPYMFILAFAIDQLFRAVGNTLDPSWATDYTSTQLILSIITLLLSLFTVIRQEMQREASSLSPDVGLFSFWSGLGFGAILYLEVGFLALPNAVSGRADVSYTLLVPLLMAATTLPLVPWVRGGARWFVGLFDSNARGWSWMLLIVLLIVLGARITGIIAGAALILAQFLTMMTWWWFVRPKAQKERNFTGLWIVVGILVFAVFVVFDIFTYEYAFVRDFAPGASLFNGLIPLDFLNEIIPPLLRGFRGLGLAVILLGVFTALLPMIQSRRRIAWQGGDFVSSLLTLILVAGFSVGALIAARRPVIQAVIEPESIRIGTYNIHAGYNEFFHYDLEAIARTIEQSGANVVLLQEVEAGRLTSFGVDQPLWLARRLDMDRRFYPTNEGLQGLAVLSNVEIVFDDGYLLESVGSQTGLQRVQIRPDAGVITLYNTWLDPLLDTGSSTATEDFETSQIAQLGQIFGIIRAHHPDGQLGRTVFGGTFNNIPGSDLIRRIQDNGFVDHFAGGTVESTATFWRTGERARLDYLWTARLTVVGRIVSDSNASDHRIATIGVQLR